MYTIYTRYVPLLFIVAHAAGQLGVGILNSHDFKETQTDINVCLLFLLRSRL